MKRTRSRVFAFALLSGSLMAGSASAKNIFDFLFGGFGGKSAEPVRRAAAPAHRNYVRVAPARPAVEDDATKYLKSAEFSHRFQTGPTGEAVAYLLHNDATLRSGDAVMTKEGVLVFDPNGGGDGKFVAIRDAAVSQSLSTRLADLERAEKPVVSGSSRAKAGRVERERTETTGESVILASDGRSIRMVGGFTN